MTVTVETGDLPSPPSLSVPEGRAALVVAHPGHELRLHGWLELVRPLVFVLTDGTGRTGRPRLASTSAVLRSAGAKAGELYGRYSDRRIYAALLDGDLAFFRGIVTELTAAFLAERIDYVVGDAAEGYNPSHDVLRLATAAAAARAAAARGRTLPHWVFPLVGSPQTHREQSSGRPILIRLDDPALRRKLAVARTYPGLEHEVEEALLQFGAEAFREEWLQPAGREPFGGDTASDPFYERCGQERVRAGVYARGLHFRTHVAPVAAALQRDQERGVA